MKSILPNRKIIILAIFTLLVLTIGFFVLGYGDSYLDKDNLPEEDNKSNLIDITMESLSKDSDNDGLKDWEEVLWKTDVDNPDTDLDGTPDGEEVKLGRDPLKPGPDDKLEEKVLSSGWQSVSQGADINTSGTSVNLTELFSRNLGFQASDGINPLSVDNQDLLSKVNSSTEVLLKDFIASFSPVISEQVLKISTNNSSEDIKNYLVAFKNIYTETSIPNKFEEDAIADAISTKNFSMLDGYIKYDQDVITKLGNLEVPKLYLNNHKRQIELLTANIEVLNNIKKVDTDPLRTIIAIDQYKRIKKEIYEILLRLVGDLDNGNF